ncbi:hypothetical protein CHUAL_007450 [Chamberlinius hualienensis]
MASINARLSLWMVLCLVITQIIADAEFNGTELEKKNVCSRNDFQYNDRCSLRCGGNSGPYLSLYSFNFFYYTTEEKDRIKLPSDPGYGSIDDATYDVTYSLSDYRAGKYQCEVQLVNTSSGHLSKIMTLDVSIEDSDPGVKLGSPCTTKQQCLTLEAQCEDSVCKCSGAFHITYNAENSSPVCLPPVIKAGPCLIDEQCQALDPETECIQGYCLHSTNKMSGGEIATLVMACLGFCLAIAAIVVAVIKGKD